MRFHFYEIIIFDILNDCFNCSIRVTYFLDHCAYLFPFVNCDQMSRATRSTKKGGGGTPLNPGLGAGKGDTGAGHGAVAVATVAQREAEANIGANV